MIHLVAAHRRLIPTIGLILTAALEVFAASAAVGEEVLAACDFVIDDPSQVTLLNDADLRVICLAPGLYDQATAGGLHLLASGTPESPRILKAFDPSHPDDRTHPVNLPADRQSVIQGFSVEGDYWVLDRLVVRDGGTNTVGTDTDEAVGTVINELLIEGAHVGGINFKQSSDSVVRRTVMRNPALRPYLDNWHIYVGAGAHQITIEENEFQNGAGAIAQGPGSEGNLIIRNNDMYMSPDRYTDCRGNINGTGPCSCSEMHIVFKGTDPLDSAVLIEGNRMWGARRNDPACASTGTPGHGINIGSNSGNLIRNIIIRQNILWDNQTNGIYLADKAANIAIENNTIFGSVNGIQNSAEAIDITIADNTLIANEQHYAGPLSVYGPGNAESMGGEQLCVGVTPVTAPRTVCLDSAVGESTEPAEATGGSNQPPTQAASNTPVPSRQYAPDIAVPFADRDGDALAALHGSGDQAHAEEEVGAGSIGLLIPTLLAAAGALRRRRSLRRLG